MYKNRKSTNNLKHYGVRGMKWSRDRTLSETPNHLKDKESNNYKTDSDLVSKIASFQSKNKEIALKYIEKRLKQSKKKENDETISRRLSYLKNKEKELKHHGVKGMKWGIRKWLKNREIKKNKREQKEERNLDKDFYTKKNEKQRVKSWEYQRKHIGKMNNRQLKSRVERLEMENRIIKTMNEQRSAKLDHIKKIIEVSNSAANLYKTIKSTGGSNNKSNGKNQNGYKNPIKEDRKREKKAPKTYKKALRTLG